ncbi:kinetochore protein NDC80 homolog [Scaptodrosophila lebanonensis]|uniref:Kinetochore protein NDC80 n=1 Tax=Drosophila lebanonensis TaxID=7225 RepID=A0A6J2SZ16_DROLE|nr:kinetochore protein NDC80 homolog [Scaptodrosophila lebanonensis]
MYQPRRTKDFHEYDDGDFNRRQTRAQGRTLVTPSPMTTMRSSTRQTIQGRASRLGQPAPLDSGRGALFGPPGSTSRSVGSSGATPMRMRATSADRPTALHSDKKWVQETAQQISDYLQQLLPSHPMPGLSSDFFERNTLRQMSTKQFVGIVNLFLQQIMRNHTIGSNHVEDIMSSMQKIKYPYTLNKSWLMTPTTQHSFGHVIVMLDFLKDFAPPLDNAESNQFPFMDTSEQHSYMHSNTTDCSSALSTTQAAAFQLDEEANGHIYAAAVPGFIAWNDGNDDEFNEAQCRIGDYLIRKRCDLPNVAAINADIETQQHILKELEEQVAAHTDEKKEQQLKQLHAEKQRKLKELSATRTNTTDLWKKCEQMCESSKLQTQELKKLRTQLGQLKQAVNQQKWTVHQWESLKTTLEDLQREAQVYEREQSELNDRNLTQQVMLSRTKKQLLDQLEQFNTNLREMHYSGLCSDHEMDKWTLKLLLNHSKAQKRLQKIEELSALAKKKHVQMKQRCQHLDQLLTKASATNTSLQLELNQFNAQALAHKRQQLANFDANNKTKHAMWAQHRLDVNERHMELDTKLEQLQQSISEFDQDLSNIQQRNNEVMCAAEKRQEERMQSKQNYINKYEQVLEVAQQELREFKITLDQNNSVLVGAREQINDPIDVSAFKGDLERILKQNSSYTQNNDSDCPTSQPNGQMPPSQLDSGEKMDKVQSRIVDYLNSKRGDVSHLEALNVDMELQQQVLKELEKRVTAMVDENKENLRADE